MPYIVDTYNAIHAGISMGGAMGGLTVRKLCQWIVASPQRTRATLVLDGRAKPDEPSENEFPEVTLIYSGAGIKADLVIAQMVERSGAKKSLTVVTNDRAVALHARRHFANAMSCEAFLGLLVGGKAGASHPRAPAPLPAKKTGGTGTPGETEHWMKEFGITPPPRVDTGRLPGSPVDEFGEIDMDKLMGGADDYTSP